MAVAMYRLNTNRTSAREKGEKEVRSEDKEEYRRTEENEKQKTNMESCVHNSHTLYSIQYMYMYIYID